MPMRPAGVNLVATLRNSTTADEDRVDGHGKPRIGCRPQYRGDVLQADPIDPDLDGLDHWTLDIFGKHMAVRADATRELDGEPAAAGAEVNHDACVAHPQRVHDPVGLLPLAAIRRLELPEILRPEQPRVLRGRQRRRECDDQGDHGEHRNS